MLASVSKIRQNTLRGKIPRSLLRGASKWAYIVQKMDCVAKKRHGYENFQFSILNSQFSSGFTLLEILIAIFIFSVLMTTLFGSYRTLLSGTRVIDKGITTYEMARNCLSRLRADLKSTYVALPPAYARPDSNRASDPYRFEGSLSQTEGIPFPKLRFTSLAHIDFARKAIAGIVEIVYYVESENGNEFVLRRADNPYPYPEFEAKKSDPILCRKIRSLKLKYVDREGEAYEEWDSDSDAFEYMTPQAVGITLEIGSESDTVIFESMVAIPVYRDK